MNRSSTLRRGLGSLGWALAAGLGLVLALTGTLRPEGGAGHAATSARRTPVVEVVERAGPAVVNISTDTIVTNPFHGGGGGGSPFDRFFRQFFEAPRPQRRVVPNSLGSGVIVDPEGYVLTNYHVLVRANRVRVTLADGTELEATPLGADPSSDLAVLELEGEGPFPAVPLGTSSDLMIGETAIAIGNPFGLSHTVTTGVISALDRSIRSPDDTVFADFIQTDASINPGNSGGPLLNIDGSLIGINTAIRQGAEGIGFAVPIDRARRVLEDIVAFGTVRPLWLGLEVRDLTPRLAAHLDVEPGGVVVWRVHDDSPAHRADIRPGDRILEIDGEPVANTTTYRTLLSHHGPGDVVPIALGRQDVRVGVRAEVEAMDRERTLEMARVRLGLVLGEPTRDERRRGMPGDVLVVREVVEGGSADRRGFRPGDIVTHLDGKRMKDLDAFAEAFGRVWQKQGVLLYVSRRGKFYRVTLEMG